MAWTPLPPGLRPGHPAVLIATGLGSGRLPGWPGTWGSLAALPLAWLIAGWLGPAGLAGAAMLAFLAGCWASGVYIAAGDDPDPSPVVIDEVAGRTVKAQVGVEATHLDCHLTAGHALEGPLVSLADGEFAPNPHVWCNRTGRLLSFIGCINRCSGSNGFVR